VHGKSRFILVPTETGLGRWGPHRYPWDTIHLRWHRGRRLKRSRHRRLADVFGARDADVPWLVRGGCPAAPGWYRRVKRRRYRGRMRQLMRKAEYDRLHDAPRDGSWYW